MYYFFIACLLLLNIQSLTGMLYEHKENNVCDVELEQLTSLEEKVAKAERDEAEEANKQRLAFRNNLFHLKRQGAQRQLNPKTNNDLDRRDEEIAELEYEDGYESYFYQHTLSTITLDTLTKKRLQTINNICFRQKLEIEAVFETLKKDERLTKASETTQKIYAYLFEAEFFINASHP